MGCRVLNAIGGNAGARVCRLRGRASACRTSHLPLVMKTGEPRHSRRLLANRTQRRSRSGLPAHGWAADIGPGLGTIATDNDPGGILTYSLAGAQYGFDLLWVCVLSYPSMVALQLVAARVAAVTGSGLTENMREHYSRWLFLLAVARFLGANTVNIAADMLAMGEAAHLIFRGSVPLFTIIFAGTSLALQWCMPYARYASYLKWLALSLFCYAGVLFIADVPWRTVAGALVPHVAWSEDFLAMLLAVLGTTVSPYLLFSQAEQEVEERSGGQAQHNSRRTSSKDLRQQLRDMRRDTLVRCLLSNLCSAFILCAAAVTLHAAHPSLSPFGQARAAAQAIAPVAGGYAQSVLGFALLGTALLALPPLAGSAAHAAASSFGWPQGEQRDRRIAGVLVLLMMVSAIIALLFYAFGVDPLRACYWSALTNGMTVSPVLILLVLLSARRDAVGEMKAHWLTRALCWLATVVICAALAAHAIVQVL
ncbi:NRAMP (natural resistance-associated macrophage protein)-like metal ion transporter [Paraburkholderia unamae]|uniref:NRAMP (Natural resistance-associated macrophage protein)-like metal ion transporter n=2 Tax=Paraburkholderia unamae TaxID=219649 RepID=A0ABX5KCT8_9BURK|nr:NRAMP (natural resistance-associated macrophage protein)-like metal ion transporter [Paraburkholderia unamae]